MAETIQSARRYRFDAKVGTSLDSAVRWKSKSMLQRVPTYQKNNKALSMGNNNYVDDTIKQTGIRQNIMLPQPLKIYRKEIANVGSGAVVHPQRGVTIESLEMPGSSVTVTPTQQTAAVQAGNLEAIVVDYQEVVHSSLSNAHTGPGSCQALTCNGVHQDAASNARRRCRSSGVLKKNYNSTSYQYLQNRNKTFAQNQYHYLQSGHSSATPGPGLAAQNVYRTQGSASSNALYDSSGVLSSCTGVAKPYTPVHFKPNNPTFSQQGAVDSSSYIQRRKFDSITKNVVAYRKVYGSAVANALSYGTSSSIFTFKDRLGFPLKKTPVFSPYTSTVKCCPRATLQV